MLNAVDWTGLLVLGGVIVSAFIAGLSTGLRYGDLRERVAKIEEWMRDRHNGK